MNRTPYRRYCLLALLAALLASAYPLWMTVRVLACVIRDGAVPVDLAVVLLSGALCAWIAVLLNRGREKEGKTAEKWSRRRRFLRVSLVIRRGILYNVEEEMCA